VSARILGRSPWALLRAPTRAYHYRALARMPQVYERPLEMLRRWALQRGEVPFDCRVRTPIGPIELTLHSNQDARTVNEVFCRNDYPAGPDVKTVVDAGANIGISAAFFLTRNPDVRCRLFEPDPRNVPRARENLAPFEGRYEIEQSAVGVEDATLDFGIEPTGRFGAIGADTGDTIEVRCREINGLLDEVLESWDRIDILKLDIEGLEIPTLTRIRSDLLGRIGAILYDAPPTPLAFPGFEHSHSGDVNRLVRR
jgi:FkbM family methyltransferase